MSARAVLDLARRHGVALRHEGDRVRWYAPDGLANDTLDDLLDRLRENKADILSALTGPPLDAAGVPDGACPACRGRLFWRLPERDIAHDPRAWRCDACSPTPPGTGMCDACAVPTEGERDD
ncbi:MAG: hypothetical protein O3B22_17545 [Proteobacteria bacterium]|nr:hypothetical protein [Pseudomonadota bacterium]MDA1174636.1 hypothetical protein [Chloroflexota bacterium]